MELDIKDIIGEKVNIDVENKLKELGITEKDLKFIKKNKKYPGVEFSKEGVLKTKNGLTLGTLIKNYYSLKLKNGNIYIWFID